jgi:nucleoside-diphosphate kinase
METTFVIFKPDCMEANRVGEVLARLENAGLRLVAAKMERLSPALLQTHYAHVKDFPFYPSLEAFMTSRPVLLGALRGENAIAKVRELLGPTDSTKAPKGTIRGDFGSDKTKNFMHASDGPESARAELARFFKPEEIF